MRPPPPSEPPRLRKLHLQDDPAGLAHLVRSALQAPRDSVPRLKGRIRRTLRRKSVWRRRYVRAAVVGGIIFVAGAVVGAVVQPIVHFRRLPNAASVENVYPSATGARARKRRATAPPESPLLQDLASEQPADVMSAPAAPDSTPSVTEPAGTPSPPAEPGPAPIPPYPADRAAVTARLPVPPSPAARVPSPSPVSKHASVPASAARTSAAPPVQSNGVEPGRHGSTHKSFDQPFHQPVRTAVLEPPPQEAKPPGWPASPSAVPQVAAAAPATHAGAPLGDLPAPDKSTIAAANAGLPRATMATPGGMAAIGAANTGSDFSAHAAKVQPAAQPQPAAKVQLAVKAQPAAAAPSGEQALLFQAVRSLRSLHHPDQALGVLDEYLARFPHGSLLPEANRLRTEALLDLGHAPAALDELNRRLGHQTNGGDEHRLVRGELYAHAGRWQEALEDFDAVVRVRVASAPAPGTSAPAKSGDLLERALWGRASARSHLGNDLGARADLREYLRRFSDGRFAPQARHLLEGLHRE